LLISVQGVRAQERAEPVDSLFHRLPARGQDIRTHSLADTAPFSQLSGLAGASIERIAVDPRDARRIYIDAQGGRIARTETGGSQWDLVEVASTSEFFRAIAVDPADSAIVLAFSNSQGGGASGGVYRSHDAGAHWRKLTTQPTGELGPARQGRGIVIDPRGRIIVLSDRAQGIFRSPDFGRTWTNPLPASQAETFPLVTDPNDSATLWTGGFDPTNANAAATWVSHDVGRTWSKVPIPILDPELNWLPVAIAVQPVTGKVLVGVDGFDSVTFDPFVKILASEDGGKTWTDSSTGLDDLLFGLGIGNSIVFDPTSADIVYASKNAGRGAYLSTDGGASWRQTGPDDDAFFTLAVTPSLTRGSARVFAGGSSFYASSDLGTTWTRPERGLEALAAMYVLDDGWRRNGIYAISSSGGLAHSWNGGRQWRQIDPEPRIRATSTIAVDPVSPLHPTYAVTRYPNAFWRSFDLGHEWSALDVPVSSSDLPLLVNLVADPLKAGRLYMFFPTEALPNRFLRSDDYGERWSTFTIGADGDFPAFLGSDLRNLTADPGDGGTLYIAMASGLWKSTDAGATWNLVSQLPLGFFGIIDLAATAGSVYVVTDAPDGSFVLEKSVDGGTTWSTATSALDGPFELAGGPGDRLFAYSTFLFEPCFDPHVLQSTDGALTWSELPATGVFANFAFGMCPFVTPTASHLYLGDPYGSYLTFGARYRDLTGRSETVSLR
jgi:photosystem II stability/assembly factor-like uncharacterized protein